MSMYLAAELPLEVLYSLIHSPHVESQTHTVNIKVYLMKNNLKYSEVLEGSSNSNIDFYRL